MQKKFNARSIQEALKKIKADLGPDAMIISTRRIQRNIHNPYGQDRFEVTAAAHQKAPDTASQAAEGVKVPPDGHAEYQSLPACLHSSACAAENHAHDDLRSELVAIKDMLFLVGQGQGQGVPDVVRMRPECLNWYVKLVKSGFPPQKAASVIQLALTKYRDQGRGVNAKALTQAIARALADAIPVMDPFKKPVAAQTLAAYVGPTGVGKTTTIAKLAAILSLKQQKKVGLISVDGFRIGAVEQLKTYAAIMGLPCIPAFNYEDLVLAVKKLRHTEIILIDTAGHGHLDRSRMQLLEEVLGGDLKITKHLVLSAGMNHMDTQEVIKCFTVFEPESYVVTKLDETRHCGHMFSQAQDRGMPISFVTNGQRVPEDILPATPKNILQYIINH